MQFMQMSGVVLLNVVDLSSVNMFFKRFKRVHLVLEIYQSNHTFLIALHSVDFNLPYYFSLKVPGLHQMK